MVVFIKLKVILSCNKVSNHWQRPLLCQQACSSPGLALFSQCKLVVAVGIRSSFRAGRRGEKQPSASVLLISKRKNDLRSSQQNFTHWTEPHEYPSCKGGWEIKHRAMPVSGGGRQEKGTAVVC